MALIAPYLPPNPHRPRAFGGKGAEGMKKGIPISKREFLSVDWLARWDAQMAPAQPNNGNTRLWNFIESVKP